MENQEQEVAAEAQANDKFTELLKQLEELSADTQGYSKDSHMMISGSLFSNITNIIGQSKQSLDAIKKNFTFGIQVIEMMENNIATLTLELMEQHINNIKAGVTTPFDVLDAEDAKEKIQEVKN